MEIKKLTDEELWNETLKEVEVERNSTLKVISFLQEINLRRLHLKRGYSSLHEYCVNVLKYSDGSAYRRIKAMKLVEDLPETKKSIENGTLNLAAASQLQQVIENRKKTHKPLAKEQKMDLFLKLDGKSKKEVEKTIAEVSPEVFTKTERERYIDRNNIQKTLVISEELHKKIEKLKRVKAHENKDFVIILEELVDLELKRIDPMTVSGQKQPASPEKLQKKAHSRYVPVQTKGEVWRNSNGQCAYVDPLTKRRCQGTRYLEIDHIIPFAKGGPTTTENLRLLCSNHNKLEALTHFKKSLSDQRCDKGATP